MHQRRLDVAGSLDHKVFLMSWERVNKELNVFYCTHLNKTCQENIIFSSHEALYIVMPQLVCFAFRGLLWKGNDGDIFLSNVMTFHLKILKVCYRGTLCIQISFSPGQALFARDMLKCLWLRNKAGDWSVSKSKMVKMIIWSYINVYI